MRDPSLLPRGLPAPQDDGAASHLRGSTLPPISLPTTDGTHERIDIIPEGYLYRIIFIFPRTGRSGQEPLVPDWDRIPGARGCTPEACGFRDQWGELKEVGAHVAGLSVQNTDYQREAVTRLNLPYPLYSDTRRRLSNALRLPSFEAGGHRLLKRLSLVIASRRIIHVFYPVFPPDRHAEEVLTWFRTTRANES